MVGYAPILGEIAKGLKIDMGAATNLTMIFVLSAAIVLILGGAICDKYGITFVLVLGLLCASVPAILMPWIGQSYKAVFFSRLIQGASFGFITTTIGPILALWFPPQEKGLAGGLLTGSLSIGAAIGVVTSPVVFMAVASWQKTMAILSTPGWIGILLTLIITRRHPSPQSISLLSEAMKSKKGEVAFRKAIFSPITWIGSFIVFFFAWGLQCLTNLVPTYLATEAPMGLGFGPIMAGKLSLALLIVGIISNLVGGIFYDKVAKGNSRPAVIVGFMLTGIFTYLILLSFIHKNLILLVICLMIAGGGGPFMNASLAAFVAVNYPPNIVGRMLGLWFGFGAFGGVAGLFLAGMAIVNSGNFNLAITMISLAAGIGLIFGFFLKPIRGLQWQ
jgi:MFS family permease